MNFHTSPFNIIYVLYWFSRCGCVGTDCARRAGAGCVGCAGGPQWDGGRWSLLLAECAKKKHEHLTQVQCLQVY